MKRLLLVVVVTLLTACGSDSKSNNQSPQLPTYSPPQVELSTLKLVDASGAPLANATVTIAPKMPAGLMMANASSGVVSTVENGTVILNNLAPGVYTLTVTVGSVDPVTVTSTITITPNNASDVSAVAVPVIVDGDTITSLQDDNNENTGIFASISGVIYSNNGPLAGAEISLSGGVATNGSVASDVTDDQGRYLLIINVSRANLEAMKTATLRIRRDGYTTFSKTFDATAALAFIGENFALAAANVTSDYIVYQDNFNQSVNGGVCGEWTAEDLPRYEDDFASQPVAFAYAGDEQNNTMLNLWHRHTSNRNISNAALNNTPRLVKLAPDDTSNGKIPEPFDGGACWYGQGSGNDLGLGNFLGEFADTNGGDELDGGTSDNPNGGAIVSPDIDLTNITGSIALTFRTWWEIESVNPNKSGFDLLMVQARQGDGAWENIARLNPFTDPETGDLDRAPLPFSNRGFNRAPAWQWQELIDISELAGHHAVQIRFVFRTQDGLYNGFRGWLIDNVRIVRDVGTFPRYDGDDWDDECHEDDCDWGDWDDCDDSIDCDDNDDEFVVEF
ncbi:MAG: hypothetical protein IBX52_12800 [Bacterioplanes sp.]|nr:hypothetical protein [Bacterioplanes sp.]